MAKNTRLLALIREQATEGDKTEHLQEVYYWRNYFLPDRMKIDDP